MITKYYNSTCALFFRENDGTGNNVNASIDGVVFYQVFDPAKVSYEVPHLAQTLNYFVAQKYVEALGKFVESNQQKTTFMPLDTSSIMGSIGGISEL